MSDLQNGKVALITGGTGLIGQALAPTLKSAGYTVRIISRKSGDIQWNESTGLLDPQQAEGADLLVHLAGANVGARRWTPAYKQEIDRSRAQLTTKLFSQIAQLNRPPSTIISAGAVGIYGDRASEILTESSKPGAGFLPEVAERWEQAAHSAEQFGARVIIPRTGIVLSTQGGALQKMLLPFSLGLGGPIGTGNQWMSWISIGDLVRAFLYLVENSTCRGVYNITAPEPSTNRDFSRALAQALSRPAFFPLPGWLVSVVFGEMGRTLLLGSTRAVPERLLASGFEFNTPTLDAALAQVIKEQR